MEIREIEIKNFRGIKECQIKDLGKVNLFIGKNNSGKSSILEALCFAKAPFKPVDALGRPVLQQLLNRRIQRQTLSLEEFIYNYKLENKVSLDFSFDTKEPISLQATGLEGQIGYDILSPIRDSSGRKLSILSTRNNPFGQDIQIDTLLGLRPPNFPRSTREPLEVLNEFINELPSNPLFGYMKENMQNLYFISETELIDHNFVNRMEDFEKSFWSRMLRSRLDKRIASVLNAIYGTEIETFTFSRYYLSRERREEVERYKLFSALSDIALHIDDYGDGFRYAISILTSALLFKNTALLIEEIESHQHPGSLKKIINELINISRANNLQLFITTHSFDVWRFLNYADAYKDGKTKQTEFRSFHVVRDANTGKVDVFPEYNIQRIQEDIFEIVVRLGDV